MIYCCHDERRRNAVFAQHDINAIDYLEVSAGQKELVVHFIHGLPGMADNPVPAGSDAPFTAMNFAIEGGVRVKDIRVESLQKVNGKTVRLTVDKPGDFSVYRLRLRKSDLMPETPDGFDKLLSSIEFSFKVECPSDFDCKSRRTTPAEPLSVPEIDYLVKDYAGFRQLMLDRLAVLVPEWKERNPADLGVALVEMLAYVGDHLSYRQDAISSEAYLHTARRRTSVRRHARLTDYFMHDGCNARVWVQVQVSSDIEKKADGPPALPKDTMFTTLVPGQSLFILSDPVLREQALLGRFEVFETMRSVDSLYQEHNEIRFYTWGSHEYCIPRGSTSATLKGKLTHLEKDDILIFEEIIGPRTSEPEDADPAHRHAVRLTKVGYDQDPLGGRFEDPETSDSVDVTEIEWADEDALPFALCISTTTDEQHGNRFIDTVSVARGNIVPADHGLTVADENIGRVPDPRLVYASSAGGCGESQRSPAVPPRFSPRLKYSPLTHAAGFAPSESAAGMMNPPVRSALPRVTLRAVSDRSDAPWIARRDLLNSGASMTEFVVETESDGTAYLRFGDDRFGMRPASGTEFAATYRVGNGAAGNVGAEAISHILIEGDEAELPILKIRNPLPATGGVEPESMEEVRQQAPSAFRIQERAVTESDYAEVAMRHPQVQRAVATFRWTGSWHTVCLMIDRLGGLPVDPDFREEMLSHMQRYRMAGHDIKVEGPCYVPVELGLTVCVHPDYFRSDVQSAVLEVLSNRTMPDGRRGYFHPDNFSFGDPVYLSRLYSAIQEVAGVGWVEITELQRCDRHGTEAIESGVLAIDRLEIARLDNDPNFRENGVIRLQMEGGK